MRPANEALIVIDMQNDFCPGGALAVQGGDEIVPGINALMDEFRAVVLTQDWHPAGHSSFASRHPGRAPDLKESYDVGVDLPLDHPTVAADLPLHGPNQWPEPAEAPGFREASEEYFDAASRLGQRLLGLFALSLGMPRDFLTKHTTNPMVRAH